MFLLTACGETSTPTRVTSTATPIFSPSGLSRQVLTYPDLINGFDPDGIISEDALRIPDDALPSPHTFQGRLELLGEDRNGEIEVLQGSLSTAYQHLPEFDFAFVQVDDYLVPLQRGLIITDDPTSGTAPLQVGFTDGSTGNPTGRA